MSSEAAKPTRPVAVMPTLTEALAAAGMPGQQQSLQNSLASLANLRSAFTPMMPQQAPALYPEIALFSQFNQLFPGAAEMAQQQQMQRNAETTHRGEPRAATPSPPRHTPLGIKQLSRGGEPGSTTGAQPYCSLFILCLFARGGQGER